MKRKHLLVFILLLVIFIPFLHAKRGRERAKIFFVNVFSKNVDVRLGKTEDDYIFSVSNFDPYAVTYMKEVSYYDDYKLFFKLPSSKDWFFWGNDKGEPFICTVEPGKIYCIVCGTDGNFEYYTLTEDNSDNPKICFFNGTDDILARMEVSGYWGKNVQAYAENLSESSITNFVSIEEGNFSVYWHFPDQKKEGTYYYYPSEKDRTKEEVFSFEKGEYSVFLAYTMDNKDYAVIYNITPQK